MPVNSSLPAIKPLAGTKKNFPKVTDTENFSETPKNSSGDEVGLNSSAVSASLKTADEDKFIQRKLMQPTEVLTNIIERNFDHQIARNFCDFCHSNFNSSYDVMYACVLLPFK